MSFSDYIVALDQGTTSSRAILFDHDMNVVVSAQKEFPQYFPQPGWVEHDPIEIWETQYAVLQEVIEKAGIVPRQIAAIGIANQRETTVVWDKITGKPVYRAIVWQCRRTASLCEQLKNKGLEEYIREKTGLIIDAYFSGTKLKWILDHIPGVRERAEQGEILFGTIDSWLVWKLTQGKVHITDATNASRTMLFDIQNQTWDEKILDVLNIPKSVLPCVADSSELYGYTTLLSSDGNEEGIPIAGIAGDQQAALFGQACFEPGDAKNTYGTGCFLLMNTGEKAVISKNGLITTVASRLDGKVQYALEGSIFVGGAIVQWLRDEMKMIDHSSDTERIASEVSDNGGVYIVPAFVGLGAPYWDMYARGTVLGLTRGSNRAHFVRAALESIAYQTEDVLSAMVNETNCELTVLKVDGGASQNSFLMQFQANICQKQVVRPSVYETTALGAAALAGLAVGFWKDKDELRKLWKAEVSFSPHCQSDIYEEYYQKWKKAIERAKHWVE